MTPRAHCPKSRLSKKQIADCQQGKLLRFSHHSNVIEKLLLQNAQNLLDENPLKQQNDALVRARDLCINGFENLALGNYESFLSKWFSIYNDLFFSGMLVQGEGPEFGCVLRVSDNKHPKDNCLYAITKGKVKVEVFENLIIIYIFASDEDTTGNGRESCLWTLLREMLHAFFEIYSCKQKCEKRCDKKRCNDCSIHGKSWWTVCAKLDEFCKKSDLEHQKYSKIWNLYTKQILPSKSS